MTCPLNFAASLPPSLLPDLGPARKGSYYLMSILVAIFFSSISYSSIDCAIIAARHYFISSK